MDKIDEILNDIYFRYKDRGIVSTYRWGSSIRDDYRPENSDFDNIIIIDNSLEYPQKEELLNFIKDNYPEVERFHINYIFVEEINGSEPKNRLTRLFPIGYLLDQFHTWKHVSGKVFFLKDFKHIKWSSDKIIQHHKNFGLEGLKNIEKDISSNTRNLILKSCIVLCYHLHKKEFGEHQYNYITLNKEFTEETKNILPILMNLRSKNYPPNDVLKEIPKIKSFLENL